MQTLRTWWLGPVLLATAAAQAAGAGAPAESRGPVTVYVGTYTDGASRGIYRFSFDPETGAAGAPTLAAELQNPSFLALHPTGRVLYAVGELPSTEGGGSGLVSALAIDAATGELRLLNQQSSEGAGPCHLVVDGSGRHVLVANYGAGTVAVLPTSEDGSLKPASSVRVHEGSGPNASRQSKPHAHGIYLDAAERFAFSPDLGADRVFSYRFDVSTGALEPHGAVAVDPGAGPRHLTFHPNGQFAYVLNELLSTVSAFAYDAAGGRLSPIQTVPGLPEGFSGTSLAAELEVSPDGQFLYASNRGHDSLAVFRIAEDGRLAASGHVPVGGKNPRHFTIDPSGRWLLAGHQGSGTIAVFRLDPSSGMPGLAASLVAIDKPVCLLPVPRRGR